MTDLVPYQQNLLGSLAGELSEGSQRIYRQGAIIFATWLQEQGITPNIIDRHVITAYRAYLVKNYAPATGKRLFSIASRLLREQVRNGVLSENPASDVHGIKAGDSSKHIALTKEQAKALLESVDTETKEGKRDYALLMTLLYTGIRRFECAALTLGDVSMEQGHHILIVQHGKGNQRGIVKLRVEAWRAIQDYLKATQRNNFPQNAPLFCQFHRWDCVVEAPISSNVVYRTVLKYAERTGIPEIKARLKPHGMRASFITLALEGGAKLEQVQYAARHKDPRTTEIYQKRKLNLDDNAVDHIHL